jgi:hypothetical protein
MPAGLQGVSMDGVPEEADTLTGRNIARGGPMLMKWTVVLSMLSAIPTAALAQGTANLPVPPSGFDQRRSGAAQGTVTSITYLRGAGRENLYPPWLLDRDQVPNALPPPRAQSDRDRMEQRRWSRQHHRG